MLSEPRLSWTRASLSQDFVVGFLQAVEGETNPRNLRLIFSLWPAVIASFEFSHLDEDVFEAISCYFPIDFRPSKGSAVTAEELAEGLKVSLVIIGCNFVCCKYFSTFPRNVSVRAPLSRRTPSLSSWRSSRPT